MVDDCHWCKKDIYQNQDDMKWYHSVNAWLYCDHNKQTIATPSDIPQEDIPW